MLIDNLEAVNELLARIERGERIDPETTKSAVAELRQGRGSAAQAAGKAKKSKASTEMAIENLKGLFL